MENLKALVYKGDLTPYQRALAQREFKDLVERLELLEKAVKNNAVLPLVSNSALQDNSKLVDNMCMSYRHDFGLMAEQDKQSLRFECKEWLRAYENNREHCC